MSDLIIKPSGTNANFKVQNPSGTNKITMDSDGVTTFASNVALSGTMTTGTLGSDVSFSQTGYAQLKLTSNATTSGELTWGSIIGDTTNITQSGSDITLVKAGVYLLTFSVNAFGTGAPERQVYTSIRQSSDDSTLVSARDSYGSLDSSTTYGNATCTLVKAVSANYQINYYYESLSDNTADLYLDTHASIVLIKPL